MRDSNKTVAAPIVWFARPCLIYLDNSNAKLFANSFIILRDLVDPIKIDNDFVALVDKREILPSRGSVFITFYLVYFFIVYINFLCLELRSVSVNRSELSKFMLSDTQIKTE